MSSLLSCIYFYSLLNGVDPQLTQAVVEIESSGNPYALGAVGDSGLMQIRPNYNKDLSQLQLFQSCTNVKRGTELLKKAMINCKHKANNTFLVCYNLGVSGGAKVKHPTLWPYFKKVAARMKK